MSEGLVSRGFTGCALAAIFVIAAACEGPTAPSVLTISVQPQGQTIAAGATATLTVAASGASPLSYQWYLGVTGTTTAPIVAATSPGYTTPALTETTSYWARVSSPRVSVDSATAVITVAAGGAPPPDPEPPPAPPPPPPAPPPPPPPDTATVFEDTVLALVNQRRAVGATCGGTAYASAPALYMHPRLRVAARGHSQDMAAQNYVSHTSLDGRTFDQRIRDAGYTGAFPLGENIAGGPSTPDAVVSGWMASPGHCANIMSPGYRALGVGYAHNPASTYRHYWTQSFGGS
jgi:uncharacterized protein YkwD